MDNLSKLLAEKTGWADLLNDLEEKISGSELNSLLLELFRKRAKKNSPQALLKQFEKNRFAQPSMVDTIELLELELRCLKLAKRKNFNLVTLSPLTSLGTSSVVGHVDQNNVVSALRGTEVVSDATNVFALLIAKEFKKNKVHPVLKYATTQRHVRSQSLSNPAFTPHFGLFCMASGGLDKGNYFFELENLFEHIHIHLSLLNNEFAKEKLILKCYLKEENENFRLKFEKYIKELDPSLLTKIVTEKNPGDYYKLVQFKIFLKQDGKEINLSDGGTVDWTQKLIPNKKHRLVISGIGTELVTKMKK
ncbi:MAG TPA: hypothetical protein VK588_11535 [Chitinophagaceae bacterium]|nr:hypothetical protein [Chitinophagaceae bacterium]